MNRLLWCLQVVFRWRKPILINAAALTLVAAAVSLILPARYTAVAQLLPPPEDDVFGLSSALSGGLGGQLGRLKAGMLSATTPSDLMVGILDSRTIMGLVAEECSVAKHYRTKDGSDEEAVKALRKLVHFTVGDEGILGIHVQARTPALAAEIANCFLVELDLFLRQSNISRGRNVRRFIEHRLNQVEGSLRTANESLEVFQMRHRTMALDQETEAAIDAYADLRSRLYMQQAELEMATSVSSDGSPYVAGLQMRTRALKSQLGRLESVGGSGFGVGFAVPFESLPAVTREFVRYHLEVRVQTETYSMLYEQYEYAKILEARDAPTITVLDSAVPPERRSFPRRTMIVAAVLLFSLAMGVAGAFVLEYFEVLRSLRPAEHDGWRRLATGVLRSTKDASRPVSQSRRTE